MPLSSRPLGRPRTGAAQPVDAVIGQRQRQQDADGDDGARDGIAQGGELDQPVERAAAHQAAGVAQEQGKRHDDHGGRGGEARLLAASRRKCDSMATAPDRHASCAR